MDRGDHVATLEVDIVVPNAVERWAAAV